jgi:hypothetical protein
MLYVIDAEGVIRYKATGYDEKLDKVVDMVLEGIESDKPRQPRAGTTTSARMPGASPR